MLRAHLPSKHYVSISITQTHVKGFLTLKTAISLYLICTPIRVYHLYELHEVFSFFYTNTDNFAYFYTLYTYSILLAQSYYAKLI